MLLIDVSNYAFVPKNISKTVQNEKLKIKN